MLTEAVDSLVGSTGFYRVKVRMKLFLALLSIFACIAVANGELNLAYSFM